LTVGDSATRTIVGYRNPNRTGLVMVHDGEYVLTTTGAWQDGAHVPPTDANGTPNGRLPTSARVFLWSFQRLRPVSNANWMALVGKIDAPNQEHFLIGVGPASLKATADGELLALANDVLHYSNNRGCVMLTVRRTK
jgi:hypothetical protein